MKNYAVIVLSALIFMLCGEARAENALIRPKQAFVLSGDEKSFIESLAPLKIMVDDNFSPLSFYDQRERSYKGISVDLLSYMLSELGVKYRLLRDPTLTWANKFESFKLKDVDMLLSASITSERKEVGVFTSSYYDTYYGCVTQRSRHIKIHRAGDLKAYTIGAVKKTSILSYVETLISPENLILYDKPEELYQAIRQGDVDIGLRNANVFYEERVASEYFDLALIYVINEFPSRYAFYLANSPENVRLAGIIDRYMSCLDYAALISSYERGEDELIIRYLDKKSKLQLLTAGIVSMAILLLVSFLAYRKHRQLAAKLAASLQIKEDMERISRHDIRSPLNGIINLPLMLMEDENLTDEQRELLGLVIAAGHKVMTQVDASLEIYKIESGTYRYSASLCSPREIVVDNSKMLIPTLGCEPSAITIHEHEGMPADFSIFTDQLLLDISVMNVLNNALEAGLPSPQVRVDLSMTQDSEYCIAISNPQVVPEEIRDRFFSKYATAGKKGGAGLGTYSVALMIRAIGGRVEMQTSEEQGTTVAMYLPL